MWHRPNYHPLLTVYLIYSKPVNTSNAHCLFRSFAKFCFSITWYCMETWQLNPNSHWNFKLVSFPIIIFCTGFHGNWHWIHCAALEEVKKNHSLLKFWSDCSLPLYGNLSKLFCTAVECNYSHRNATPQKMLLVKRHTLVLKSWTFFTAIAWLPGINDSETVWILTHTVVSRVANTLNKQTRQRRLSSHHWSTLSPAPPSAYPLSTTGPLCLSVQWPGEAQTVWNILFCRIYDCFVLPLV